MGICEISHFKEKVREKDKNRLNFITFKEILRWCNIILTEIRKRHEEIAWGDIRTVLPGVGHCLLAHSSALVVCLLVWKLISSFVPVIRVRVLILLHPSLLWSLSLSKPASLVWICVGNNTHVPFKSEVPEPFQVDLTSACRSN